MAAARNATPLIALDAVVIDTETTGLDPAKARVVEIAAVRLIGGRISADDTFRCLVRPGEPIPATASAVHHIDDAKVANAPAFAEVWTELLVFIGSSVLIGHTLGFDLAVLKRECERAGLPFHHPRTLDTRLLAQVAEPNLAATRSKAWQPGWASTSPTGIPRSATPLPLHAFLARWCRSCGTAEFARLARLCSLAAP